MPLLEKYCSIISFNNAIELRFSIFFRRYRMQHQLKLFVTWKKKTRNKSNQTIINALILAYYFLGSGGEGHAWIQRTKSLCCPSIVSVDRRIFALYTYLLKRITYKHSNILVPISFWVRKIKKNVVYFVCVRYVNLA